ncbi:MAG TPA: hypothetical protein VEU28_08815 [Actinomycetota bacterium]|nr:hypothetical protein [Actinomycetota bacterium]
MISALVSRFLGSLLGLGFVMMSPLPAYATSVDPASSLRVAVGSLMCALFLVLKRKVSAARLEARLRGLPRLSAHQISDLLDDYKSE